VAYLRPSGRVVRIIVKRSDRAQSSASAPFAARSQPIVGADERQPSFADSRLGKLAEGR
jgi:hypothetical protein